MHIPSAIMGDIAVKNIGTTAGNGSLCQTTFPEPASRQVRMPPTPSLTIFPSATAGVLLGPECLAAAVYKVVNSRSYPGWGNMIDRGATTIWETWKESDDIYSNCHSIFGSVSEWMYRWLAGIRPDPDHPGFEKFTIAPSLPAGLDHVTCSYHQWAG